MRSRNDAGANRRFSQFREEIVAQGGRVLEPNWLGAHEPHRVVCRDGHETRRRPRDVTKGVRCRVCAGRETGAAERRFRELITAAGGQVIESNWLGVSTPHRVVCDKGHETRCTPSNMAKRRSICLVCLGLDTREAERLFRGRVAAAGGRVIGQWRGAARRCQVICAAGHEVLTHPAVVRETGHICRICTKRDSATAERKFHQRMADLGGVVVEPRWMGNKYPHRIICAAGHETTVRPNNIDQGHGICRVCSGYDKADAERRFRERVTALGGTVVEPIYLGADIPHRIICPVGHHARTRPGLILAGRGICRACAGCDPETAWAAFRARVAELGGQVIEPEWLGKDRPHRIVCREGHAGAPTPGSVRSGQGICAICAVRTEWDVFYVVTNDAQSAVKFGITTHGGKRRLETHHRSGYGTVIRAITGMPDARALERSVLATLKLAECRPVRGREYFDATALPVILDIVDHWPSAQAAHTD